MDRNKWIKMGVSVGLAISTAALWGCGKSEAPASGVASSAATPVKKIVVGTTGTTTKWSESNDKGSVQGFDIDLFNEIARRNHWEVEWRVAEMQALWGMLDNDQIVTIANDTTKNKQREEKYNFSDIYAYGGYLFLTKKDYPAKDDGIESFRNKKVAVEANTNVRLVLEALNDQAKAGLDITYLDNQSASLMAVSNGQVDAAFVSRTAGYIALNSLKMDLTAHDAHYRTVPVCYAFKRTPESDAIREQINQTLAEIRKDGTAKKLSMKWFNTDFTEKGEGKI